MISLLHPPQNLPPACSIHSRPLIPAAPLCGHVNQRPKAARPCVPLQRHESHPASRLVRPSRTCAHILRPRSTPPFQGMARPKGKDADSLASPPPKVNGGQQIFRLFVSRSRPCEAIVEIRREVSALRFLCKVSSTLKFRKFQPDDCFAALQIAVGGFLPALSLQLLML